MNDFLLIDKLGKGKIDATVGSALDIFGGAGVTMEELIQFNLSSEKDEAGR